MDLVISRKLLIFALDLIIINSKIMYNINLIRYALTNQCGDSTIYKTRKIIEHYLEVIQDGEFLYNFKDKDEACQHLTDLILAKTVNDVPSLGNNDSDLIKLVLENKALFDENANVLGDIKEKAKSFKYTVFEFETIEDYKAALEDFILNDGSVIVDNVLTDNGGEAAMAADESDETPNMEEISEMLDNELFEMEMLNGKELPTKPKYAIAERKLGIGATDWELTSQGRDTFLYHDLGYAIDHKPSNFSANGYIKEYEVVNLADPNWKQSLIENDENEYFVMRRELIRGGTDATDWEIDTDIYETWAEAKWNMQRDYDNFQFIIASRPKEKEKTVYTRRKIFNFGD